MQGKDILLVSTNDDEMSLLLRKVNAVLTINEEISARISSARGPVVMRNNYHLAIDRDHNGMTITTIRNNPEILDSVQIVQQWRRGHRLSDSLVMDIFNDSLNDMIKKTKTFNDLKILNLKFTTIAPKWAVLRSTAEVLAGLKANLGIVEVIQCCFGELESKLQSVQESRTELDERVRLVNESLEMLQVLANKDSTGIYFTPSLIYNWADSSIFSSMSLKQLSTIESMIDRSIFPNVSKTYQPTPILIYQASRDSFTTLFAKVTEFVGLKRNPLFSGHLLFIFNSNKNDGGGTIGFIAPLSKNSFSGTVLGIDIPTLDSDPSEIELLNQHDDLYGSMKNAQTLKQLLSNVISFSDKPITPQNNNTSTFESFRYVSWTSGPPPNHGQRRLNTTTVNSPTVRGRCINVTDAVVYAFEQGK